MQCDVAKQPRGNHRVETMMIVRELLLLLVFAAQANALLVPTPRSARVKMHIGNPSGDVRSLYPYIRGDLRARPIVSAVALAACGVGGATVGACFLGLEGFLLGSAAGWSVASLGDTIYAARQEKAAERQRAFEAELPLLRELEVMESNENPRLSDEMRARLTRMYRNS